MLALFAGYRPKTTPIRTEKPIAIHAAVELWLTIAAPGRFPIFIWMFGDAQEDYMYGFPGADAARPVLKVATEQYEHTTTPDTLEREVSVAEIEAMYRSRVEGRFPQIGGRAVKARACMYTVTPDRNFVVDALDGAPHVLIASACRDR